jgi:hypothetical protein
VAAPGLSNPALRLGCGQQPELELTNYSPGETFIRDAKCAEACINTAELEASKLPSNIIGDFYKRQNAAFRQATPLADARFIAYFSPLRSLENASLADSSYFD